VSTRLLLYLAKAYACFNSTGVGISIVSGRVEGPQALSGIFIKNVLPESPAGVTGQLFTGDRIVAVGGVELISSDQVPFVIWFSIVLMAL